MTSGSESSGKPPGGQGPADKPKIILPGGAADEETPGTHADESWKEKARKEKEKLAEAAAASQGTAGERELPPASFLGLLEDLAVRVMFALGQLRDPGSQEVYLDLEGAKYSIDMLAILEEKTKGNLDPTETATLKDLLNNLRGAFVQISRSVGAAMAAQAKAGTAPGAAGSETKKPGKGASGDKPPPKIII